MSNDPILQPYQLKHLRLKNRIMSTSHEPPIPRMACRRIATGSIIWRKRKAASH